MHRSPNRILQIIFWLILGFVSSFLFSFIPFFNCLMYTFEGLSNHKPFVILCFLGFSFYSLFSQWLSLSYLWTSLIRLLLFSFNFLLYVNCHVLHVMCFCTSICNIDKLNLFYKYLHQSHSVFHLTFIQHYYFMINTKYFYSTIECFEFKQQKLRKPIEKMKTIEKNVFSLAQHPSHIIHARKACEVKYICQLLLPV